MKNNLAFKVVSIVDLVLLLVSVYANIVGVFSDSSYIQYIFNLIAIFFAIHYCFVGYKKSGNLYYRLFAGFLALKEIAAITHVAMNEEVPFYTFILLMLCYSAVLIIAVAKDLGKKTSFALAIMLVVLSAFTLTYVARHASYLRVITYNATRLLLALVLGVMVWAKYKDKETRNTK